ncbi:hypothetical protein VCV18_005123 [Metarhizium anisopliae]
MPVQIVPAKLGQFCPLQVEKSLAPDKSSKDQHGEFAALKNGRGQEERQESVIRIAVAAK